MVVIKGNIDEVVLECLKIAYPAFNWHYGMKNDGSKDYTKAIGFTDKFIWLAGKGECIFDKVLNWFSVSDYIVFT